MSTEKFYAMDDGGDFVEVIKSTYDSPDEHGMINNKICIRTEDDGVVFMDIAVANCDTGSLYDFLRKFGGW